MPFLFVPSPCCGASRCGCWQEGGPAAGAPCPLPGTANKSQQRGLLNAQRSEVKQAAASHRAFPGSDPRPSLGALKVLLHGGMASWLWRHRLLCWCRGSFSSAPVLLGLGGGKAAIPPWAAVLTAGCRPGGTQDTGLGGPAFADGSGSRGGAGLPAGLMQTGRRSDVPCRAALADEAAAAQARKDPVPFLPRVVSQGLLPCQGLGVVTARPRWGWEWEDTNSHIVEVSAGASQSFWLCGDAKCWLLWHLLCRAWLGIAGDPGAGLCSELFLKELQETGQERAEDLGKLGRCSCVPSPLPACRVGSGTSILAAVPCPQAVLLLQHGEIKHFDFVS